MIRFVEGDIFESNAEALVNPVNTVGVMGKGLALEFKKRFPDNFAIYSQACKSKQVNIGKMFVTTEMSEGRPQWIINFPTKEHWRGKSYIGWITEGLYALRKFIVDNKIKSVAIPALGAGLGGLKWEQVKYWIDICLEDMEYVDIMVYPPKEEK